MSTHNFDLNHALVNTSQVQEMATVIHNIDNALTGVNSALRHICQSQADLQRICAWLQDIDSESSIQNNYSRLSTSLLQAPTISFSRR